MGDIDLVEQVEFDHLQLDACFGRIGTQFANLRPCFCAGHHLVAEPRQCNGRAAAETRACARHQDLLGHE
ncbi:hypothetical protein D3C85_1853720 [compost metagenome]